ncbi:MAG: hypothetical protein ACJAYX_002826 [Planctomycetota bacterium]|jgi:hypothetical protein
MRSLLSLAAVISAATLFSAATVAQSPLVAPFNSDNGQSGNQFDLVATSPVIISGFDVNIDAGVWDLEVYTVTGGGTKVGVENNASAWTLVGSATGVTGAGLNLPTPLPIALAIPIAPGQTQGFYVTVSNGTSMNYTNGVTPQGVLASNGDLTILEGTGHSYPFGSLFNPRNFNANIYYSVAAGTFAVNQVFGTACGGSAIVDGTFYEVFDAANPVDIANTNYTLSWTGSDYVVVPGATPFYTPTGADLGLGDDVVVALPLPFGLPTPQGVLNEVYLGSNGYIGFQSGLPGDFTETVAELLSQQTRLAFFWDDLEPNSAASGDCTAELDGAGVFHITFTDVPTWGSTTSLNTIQVSLNPSGTIELKYGTIGSPTGIVGFSTGNGATDPGATDLTAVAALVITTGAFIPDLTLAGGTRPIIGTNWDLVTTGIDAVSPISITFFGSRMAAGLPLTSIGINAPGCDANINNLLGSLSAANVAGSSTVSITLPNNPALIGQVLSGQSLGLSLVNGANIVVSNGLEGTVGDL